MKAPIRGEPSKERVEQRIVIERDGSVTARSGKVEYGQGIRTGFAKIVAEELGLPIGKVQVELGETDQVPWDMGTVGSMSTAVDGRSLRAAAIHARTLLVDRASARLGLPPAALSLSDGHVHAPDGRAVAYEDLTDQRPLAGAVPETANATNRPIEEPIDAPLRLEARDIVTGQALYPADVRLPGMLRGHVLHPPRPGARLVSLDADQARGMAGVIAVVQEGDFVGVAAERDEHLFAALHALKAEWDFARSESGKPFDGVMRCDEGVEAAFSRAPLVLRTAYHTPHISHGSICPRSAVADIRDDGADLFVATQRPFGLRDEVADLLGLDAGQVHIHPMTMSGMYGRGNAEDASIEAVRLSRVVKRPVLVQWSRGEEFRLSPHRPASDGQLEGALDASGAIVGWRHAVRTNSYIRSTSGFGPGMLEATAGRNAEPPYHLGHADIRLHVEAGAVPTISFRSLGAAPNVFAVESFIDELAHASQQDSIAFRLRLTDDPRLRRVLEVVRERSGWTQPRRKRHGLGVACAIYHGTYVAQVVDVIVGSRGEVRLDRAWCAVDAGRMVHPDGARNQIEGGIQQAASWTLLEELLLKDSAVMSSSWRDYPIATIRDAPRDIDVIFVGAPTEPSTGVGEPGSVPTAAAIANAVFDACGVRVRRLPLATALAALLSQKST